MEARTGNSILDFETLFSDFQELLNGSGSSVLETPPNCRSFYDDLYQTQLSDWSAFPESRLQTLSHPYSPLRANAFLRISRNRVQASNPHLNKSFGMKSRFLGGTAIRFQNFFCMCVCVCVCVCVCI